MKHVDVQLCISSILRRGNNFKSCDIHNKHSIEFQASALNYSKNESMQAMPIFIKRVS